MRDACVHSSTSTSTHMPFFRTYVSVISLVHPRFLSQLPGVCSTERPGTSEQEPAHEPASPKSE
eukprot:2982939-Pyramimonas_sp.AAC.1